MLSSWSDQIYCTVCKDGSLSLRRRLHDPDYSANWLPSLRKVKWPSQLIDQFEDWISYGAEEVELDSLLPGLFAQLPKFALATYAIQFVDDRFRGVEQVLCNSAYTPPRDFKHAKAFGEVLAEKSLSAIDNDQAPAYLNIEGIDVQACWEVKPQNLEIQDFLRSHQG